MKKIAFLLFLCILISLGGCGEKRGAENTPAPTVVPKSAAMSAPEGSISFKVRNSIGGDIYEMNISPNSLDKFGEDVLGESVLKNGEETDAYFMPPDSYSYWDLRVLTENGNIYTWQNIEFGKISYIELRLGENGPEFTAE